jgi:hypothetical protein
MERPDFKRQRPNSGRAPSRTPARLSYFINEIKGSNKHSHLARRLLLNAVPAIGWDLTAVESGGLLRRSSS